MATKQAVYADAHIASTIGSMDVHFRIDGLEQVGAGEFILKDVQTISSIDPQLLMEFIRDNSSGPVHPGDLMDAIDAFTADLYKRGLIRVLADRMVR